jgi:hypothetical protein
VLPCAMWLSLGMFVWLSMCPEIICPIWINCHIIWHTTFTKYKTLKPVSTSPVIILLRVTYFLIKKFFIQIELATKKWILTLFSYRKISQTTISGYHIHALVKNKLWLIIWNADADEIVLYTGLLRKIAAD